MVIGCGPTSPLVGALETTSEGSSGDPAGGTTSLPDASSSSDESTGEPPGSFIDDPDAGPSFECDLSTQNCPAGHKCNPWANDGGSAWNATRCVEIFDDPDAAGEPCTVEGSGVSGIDSCELGAMCWDVDPETLEGVCREFCANYDSDPSCADPDMQCGGPRDFPLCLPVCCPVEQDCAEGQACYAINQSFYCAPDASGDLGAFGDPCEFINVCDPGLLCLDPQSVPDCEGSIGCCTPFCTVGSDSCAEVHPDLTCVAWFEEDEAPPGYELTGVCIVEPV